MLNNFILDFSEDFDFTGESLVNAPPNTVKLIFCDCYGLKENLLSRALPRFTGLRILDLYACEEFTGEFIRYLQPSIEKLVLSECWELNENYISYAICNFPKLEISLNHTNIEGKCIKDFKRNKTVLYLKGCIYLKEENLNNVRKFYKLEELNIAKDDFTDNNNITGEFFKYLSPNSNMKELYLNCRENVKDGFLGSALKNFTQLKCAGFGGTGINGQCTNFLSNTVSELYLWGCKLDERYLIENFKRLIGLHLLNLENTNTTGECLLSLFKSKNLKDLNIGRCNRLKKKYICIAFTKILRNLEIVTLTYDKNFSAECSRWITKSTKIKLIDSCGNSRGVLQRQQYNVLGMNLEDDNNIIFTPDIVMGLLSPDILNVFSEDFEGTGIVESDGFKNFQRRISPK